MPTPLQNKKAGLFGMGITTLALVVSGCFLYPAKLYTPEETYQVAVLCKNPLPDECAVLENIVYQIPNFVLQKNLLDKNKSKLDFIFVLDRKMNLYYEVYITNNRDEVISEAYFENSSHSDNPISKEMIFLALRSIGYK